MKNDTPIPSSIQTIAQAIYDKKGEHIVVIDVRNVCSCTDYFIFAEGSVPRHVSSIASHIITAMKAHDQKPCHIEGLQEGDWVVIDFLDIIVHVLTAKMRSIYTIEEIWSAGKIIPVEVK